MTFYRAAWRAKGKYAGIDGATDWVPDRAVAETWRGGLSAGFPERSYFIDTTESGVVWTDVHQMAFDAYLDQLNAAKQESTHAG